MHPSSDITLAVAVFLASCVESVEALTIIVAAGVSRGWRSALEGAAVALGVLIVLVAALGPALVHLVPIDALHATGQEDRYGEGDVAGGVHVGTVLSGWPSSGPGEPPGRPPRV